MTTPVNLSGNLDGLLKSINCGELRIDHAGKDISLCGWVNRQRDLGGLNFLDLRDKSGVIQLAFDEFEGDLTVLKDCSLESVIRATGIVRARPEAARNKEMATGDVELSVKNLEVLSKSEIPPFLPHGKVDANEDFKLKYRYLDLRSDKLQRMLTLRSTAAQNFRNTLYQLGFTEVETPILYKSTPEGARDYVVPSRVHPGKVYALPQSPQTLKQLLMIGGTDKYFQITKCFRDEDLRADRQPEFTQVDIEVSFTTQKYMKNLTTHLVRKVFSFSDNFEIPTMTYAEALKRYGSDKPDVRFELEHKVVNSLFENSGFSVFSSIAEEGLIKAIFLSANDGELPRKEIDALANVVKPFGGKGVAWFKVKEEEISGGISKFITPEILEGLQNEFGNKGENGIFLFFGSDTHKVTHDCADAVRRHLGKLCNLIDENDYKFLWVNDFPLLEYDEDAERFFACHHPFTQPHEEDLEKFLSGDKLALKSCRAEAYDLVCNGYEVAGGSMRIYDQKVQKQMFKVLGFTEEEAKYQFGFFIEALSYGTPPHGGIAFGFDRAAMLLAKTDNIRDVIAFPKTTSAQDLMSGAPSLPSNEQWDELGLNTKEIKKD